MSKRSNPIDYVLEPTLTRRSVSKSGEPSGRKVLYDEKLVIGPARMTLCSGSDVWMAWILMILTWLGNKSQEDSDSPG